MHEERDHTTSVSPFTWNFQGRWDRDDYVNIMTENIEPDMKNNFDKYHEWEVSHYSLPYDYLSVMHYGSRFFSLKRSSKTEHN